MAGHSVGQDAGQFLLLSTPSSLITAWAAAAMSTGAAVQKVSLPIDHHQADERLKERKDGRLTITITITTTTTTEQHLRQVVHRGDH